MKSIIFLAAALLAAAEALPEQFKTIEYVKLERRGKQLPKQQARLGSETSQGCFKGSGDMKLVSKPGFNSMGGCATNICKPEGYKVAATTLSNECWCGNTLPRKSELVNDSKCDMDCYSYDPEKCGGLDTFSVYHTGISMDVRNEEEKEKSSTTSASSEPTPTDSKPKETHETSATPTSEPEEEKKGTNVAGIAAGVVVGVVVIAAILGGGFFYMRRKRNKEIEEEHRRNAAVNAFIGKPPGSSGGGSLTDSRLDPVMAHRRMSDGSIADNQDYSRRILRVTNA